MPPPGWPQQGAPGDWSAPGYGNWAPQRNNGLGITALVLGIVGLFLSFTVVLGVPLGIAAVVFGFLGRGRVSRHEADNPGVATSGIVLGVLTILIGVAFGAWVASEVVEDQRRYDACIRDGEDATVCEDRYGVSDE